MVRMVLGFGTWLNMKSFIVVKRVASDPQFEIAERFPMMPRDEVYNEAIRLYAVYRQRIQEYQYSDPWDKISGAQNFFKE